MKSLSAVVFSLGIFGFTTPASAACGRFTFVAGEVHLQSQPASVGTAICAGDSVEAGLESRAQIKMEDGNELSVSPDSKLTLEAYDYIPAANRKNVLLNLLKGKVRATTSEENMYNDSSKDGQVNTFRIRTRSTVVGVRGTDFVASFNPATNQSQIVTFRGLVEFGQQGPGGKILNAVRVGVGQSSISMGGQRPGAPRSMAPQELQRMNKETRGGERTGERGGGRRDEKQGSQHSDEQNSKKKTPALGSDGEQGERPSHKQSGFGGPGGQGRSGPGGRMSGAGSPPRGMGGGAQGAEAAGGQGGGQGGAKGESGGQQPSEGANNVQAPNGGAPGGNSAPGGNVQSGGGGAQPGAQQGPSSPAPAPGNGNKPAGAH